MRNTIKLDIAKLTPKLIVVKTIRDSTDNMTTAKVCNMYIDLCAEIANAVKPTVTGKIAEQMQDNIDRTERHNVAGALNKPTAEQIAIVEDESKP